MSWLEKLDSGRVRAVYRDEAGRRRSRTFDRRAEAKAWLASEATDRARGQWVDPRGGALLFGDWAERWLAARLVRPSTAANDRGRYRTHLAPAFGATPLREISPLRVRAFTAELATRRAPATVRHVHALLSAMLSARSRRDCCCTTPVGAPGCRGRHRRRRRSCPRSRSPTSPRRSTRTTAS